MKNKYDDIINIPYIKSKAHRHMPLIDRAAQFSPFAALPGYGEAIDETARFTDTRIELDEYEKGIINEKLMMISELSDDKSKVSITYFKADVKKNGGKYLTHSGLVKKVDAYEKHILMADGTVICFDDIIGIDGEFFKIR